MRIDEIHRKEDNPRLIKDEKFKKLCQSINEFPKMMALRPIIYDEETKEILGGNMRHKALEHLGYTEMFVIISQPEMDSNWLRERERDNDSHSKHITHI